MCGAPVSGKAPKVASPPQELDLLPVEPSKGPVFEQPPGVAVAPGASRPQGAPPGRRAVDSRRGAASHTGGGSGKFVLVGVVLAALLVGFLALKFCGGGPETKIVGRPKFDAALTLYANQPRVENLQVTGVANYTFEVNALDGDVLIGVARRSPKDPATPAALKRLPEKLTLLRKGETRQLTGKMETGSYSWIVLNEAKKPAKVKVKFTAQ